MILSLLLLSSISRRWVVVRLYWAKTWGGCRAHLWWRCGVDLHQCSKAALETTNKFNAWRGLGGGICGGIREKKEHKRKDQWCVNGSSQQHLNVNFENSFLNLRGIKWWVGIGNGHGLWYVILIHTCVIEILKLYYTNNLSPTQGGFSFFILCFFKNENQF